MRMKKGEANNSKKEMYYLINNPSKLICLYTFETYN